MNRVLCTVVAALLGTLVGTGGHGQEAGWLLDDVFGETGRGRSELRDPVDLAFVDGGTLAVLDRSREAVVLFSEGGRWIKTLGGSRGEGELGLRRPTGIASDPQGRLWVVDSGNHRLVKLDLEGKVLDTVGSLGSAAGRFRHPTGLAFDGRGRLYVADTGNDRIQVFTAEGEYLAAWERRTGGRRDYLEKPVRLAYTDQARGGLWVLNQDWTRLVLFDRDGTWVESREVPAVGEEAANLVGLAVEPVYYRMFLSDAVGGRILVLDRRGGLMAEVTLPEGRFEPRGLAITRRMDILAADGAEARVLKFRSR
ncbi:MAG: NHL repeat-containing protein [Thermodesulfobacteriota bacterium]